MPVVVVSLCQSWQYEETGTTCLRSAWFIAMCGEGEDGVGPPHAAKWVLTSFISRGLIRVDLE